MGIIFVFLSGFYVYDINNTDNSIVIPNIDETTFIFEQSKEITKKYELFHVESSNNIETENIVFEEKLNNEEGISSGFKIFDEVPLLYQTDYPDIKFSQGSVATSGCGVSCAAMAVSYLTNEIHTPGEFGEKFNKSASSNDHRMENALTAFNVKWEKCFNYFDMKEKVKEGYLAIILVNGATNFTSEGHFILAVGINDEDKILINDPYQPNYNNYKIKDGYKNGFLDWQITSGYCGCWLIEPKVEYQNRINS